MGYKALVARPPKSAVGEYSFILRYLGGNRFRRVMGPEPFLPAEWLACHDASVPGQNLCPLSYSRKMARGSGGLIEFAIDERPGENHGRMASTGSWACHKYD